MSAPSAGAKVTTDPEASRNPVKEGTGTIISDSLAGESIASGGAFAAKNPGVAADPQPAHGTTTNTTDTSSARELPAAANAAARDGQDRSGGSGLGGQGQRSAGQGQGVGQGGGSAGGFSGKGGGSGSGSGGVGGKSSAVDDTKAGSHGTSSSSATTAAGIAPTYVNAAQQGRDPGELKPKGSNLQQGGFEGNEPNASLGQAGTDNIGSENDPGRVAEQKFQNRTAEAAGSAAGSRDMKGSGAAQGGGSSGGYDALGEEKLG